MSNTQRLPEARGEIQEELLNNSIIDALLAHPVTPILTRVKKTTHKCGTPTNISPFGVEGWSKALGAKIIDLVGFTRVQPSVV